MCNHFSAYQRKLGRFLSGILGEEFSETKIPLRFGNLPDQIYPDRPAVVLRVQGDGYTLDTMRWGFPKITDAEGKPEQGATWGTNARHVVNEKTGGLYPHWAEWTDHEYRCLVPATSFFEPDGRTVGTGAFREVEFARADGEPFFFAGLWRPWTGARGTKKEPVVGDHELFTFLTTWPNELVKPVHKKAMPVILSWEDAETWLHEPIEDAIKLQRSAPEDMLVIVEPADT
jgi:putative SOS response-associated peptidase YedK